GTLICVPNGAVRIEYLMPGEEVISSFGTSTVARVIRKLSSVLTIVHLEDGRTISTTPNHPFFTDLGWVCAGHLEGRLVKNENLFNLRRRVPGGKREEILWEVLLSEMADASTGSSSKGIFEGGHREKGEIPEGAEARPLVEQGDSHENRKQKEVEGIPKEDGASSERSWRERARTYLASAPFGGKIRIAVENGTCHSIGREAAWLSNMLQGRLRMSVEEVGHRMRWMDPLESGGEGKGREEGGEAQGTRVVRVEIKELRSPIDVFDLELKGTPHFFAEGVLVHNSTSIKSPDSKRTDVVQRLGAMARQRRIMSGLIAPRSPLDLFAQFEFLDRSILGFRNYFFFKLRHAITRQ